MMADRCDIAVAPGQPYIEVEHDYEYTSKDRVVTIKHGECYLLVKKTNEDWWQVRKEENSKPFYVPAQYVREVRRALMPPPKPLPNAGSGVGTRGGSVKSRPSALELKQSDENLNKRSPAHSPSAALQPPKEDKCSLKSPIQPGGQVPLNVKHGSLPRTRAKSPLGLRAPLDLDGDSDGEGDKERSREGMQDRNEYRTGNGERERKKGGERADDGDKGRRREGEKVMDGDKKRREGERTTDGGRAKKGEGEQDTSAPREVLEKNLNDSESGDELSSSSTEQLQDLKISQSSQPPLPSSSPLNTHGDWETHKDQNGRHFYYNRATQERTWKPPRARESKKEERHDTASTETEPSSERSGFLNVTKITEQGKKVRKNWSSSWAVLQGSLLIFAKNQGTATSWFGSHQSKPDFSIDLRGATVERASKDKSSKKHVLEVKTRQGTEILIQSDVENTINEWFKSLTEAINTHAWESDEAIEEDMPESPGPEKHDKEKEHRDSKKLRAMKNSTSMDSTEQKKTKKQLKKFLIRRPTLQAVRDKGYIKDQVFGCNLISLCQRENTTVPHFVRMCIDHVENHGLNLDGLYRVSGNLAIIQKLRFTVNHDEKINFEDSKWEDIHVITGALKMFFRELPEPLFTHTLFNDFVAAIKIPDYKQKVQAVKDKVQKLPRPNHDTMQALFKHLKKVIEHGEKNRMTTQSVAIVFGPTLLRPEIETLNMAVHMVYQNQIVELVLLEYDTMFGR
uniref:Rho GTPase-activating protein 12-like n=1 Tax=Pygocentrus nattereri TaxID=42514 RepID=A0AAR2JYA9_PYGNA